MAKTDTETTIEDTTETTVEDTTETTVEDTTETTVEDTTETTVEDTTETTVEDTTETTTEDTTETTIEDTTETTIEDTTEDSVCRAKMLELLEDGPKRRQDFVKAVPQSDGRVDVLLRKLQEQGIIVKLDRGLYDLIRERTEAQNTATINKLLYVYDRMLNKYLILIDKELKKSKDLEKKPGFLNDFKVLVSTIDTLMKRWYLVHRGYDSNSRQAQEDAKAKAAEAERLAQETGTLEDQVEEIAHWHPIMQKVFMALPDGELEEISEEELLEKKV